MAFFTGSNALPLLETSTDYDPRRGLIISQRFRGRKKEVDAQYAAYVIEKRNVSRSPVSSHAGYWDLVLTTGAEDTQPPLESLADLWTLRGNDIELSLWELPAVATELAKASDGMAPSLRQLRSDIIKFVDGEKTTTNITGSSVTLDVPYLLSLAATMGMDQTVIRNLIKSLSRGVESYSRSQYVLVHTKVVAANFSGKPSITNVGKIYTTTPQAGYIAITNAETIPFTIKFDLAAGYWLKRSPTVTQISSDKFEFQREWWHADAYDPFLYLPAT